MASQLLLAVFKGKNGERGMELFPVPRSLFKTSQSNCASFKCLKPLFKRASNDVDVLTTFKKRNLTSSLTPFCKGTRAMLERRGGEAVRKLFSRQKHTASRTCHDNASRLHDTTPGRNEGVKFVQYYILNSPPPPSGLDYHSPH